MKQVETIKVRNLQRLHHQYREQQTKNYSKRKQRYLTQGNTVEITHTPHGITMHPLGGGKIVQKSDDRGQVIDILFNNGDPDGPLRFIVVGSRLPQAITAVLAGAALTVSGLMLQTAFRNPLAGPSILGITSGSSLGVAFVILFFGGSHTPHGITMHPLGGGKIVQKSDDRGCQITCHNAGDKEHKVILQPH